MIIVHQHRVPFMILYATALHIVWGSMLLLDDAVLNITAINIFTQLLPPSVIALVFLAVASSSLAVLSTSSRWAAILWAIPQGITLSVSAIGALQAMWLSQFADGVDRPRAFLIADQAPAVLVAIFYILSIVMLAKSRPVQVHHDLRSV